MRVLPLEVPKLMVSSIAAGDTSPYVGTTNITMMPSIVDVAGLNRISRRIFTHAAGAICGMVREKYGEPHDQRPLIAASMFGNTTRAVDGARQILESKGYEVLVFHATGMGGKTMEMLIGDKGEAFWWPKANEAFVRSLKANIRSDILVVLLDSNINDPEFARKSAEVLIEMLKEGKGHGNT